MFMMMLILDCLFFAVFFVRSSFAFFTGKEHESTVCSRAFNAPHRTNLIVKSCSCSFESIPVTVLVSTIRNIRQLRAPHLENTAQTRLKRWVFPRKSAYFSANLRAGRESLQFLHPGCNTAHSDYPLRFEMLPKCWVERKNFGTFASPTIW